MTTSENELEALFQQELESQHEELRHAAALNTLHRLHLSNRVTVEQFLQELQRHKDLWEAASKMGVRDVAEILIASSER